MFISCIFKSKCQYGNICQGFHNKELVRNKAEWVGLGGFPYLHLILVLEDIPETILENILAIASERNQCILCWTVDLTAMNTSIFCDNFVTFLFVCL